MKECADKNTQGYRAVPEHRVSGPIESLGGQPIVASTCLWSAFGFMSTGSSYPDMQRNGGCRVVVDAQFSLVERKEPGPASSTNGRKGKPLELYTRNAVPQQLASIQQFLEERR